MFSLALVPRAGKSLPWRNAALGNPCKGLERNPEEGREQFFSQLELVAISDALAEYPGVAADCVRLIMLTGCRPAEAMKAGWSEFDSEPGFWIKPSAHVKQRKTHKLPLSPAALELVDRLRAERQSEWVLPGDKPGEHLAALWHVWHFVRERTGLGKEARIYDLRHTFASIGLGEGSRFLGSSWAIPNRARRSDMHTSLMIHCARRQTRLPRSLRGLEKRARRLCRCVRGDDRE